MLNLHSRSPLAGVHLFNSKTYPTDVGVYWRGQEPIAFEIDYSDEPEAFPNLLDHVYNSYELLECHRIGEILISKIQCGKTFYAICDGDTLVFSHKKPVFEDQRVSRPSNLVVGVHETLIAQALLAVSFSPVDLAWLTGENTIGLYEERIWEYARKHLPVH